MNPMVAKKKKEKQKIITDIHESSVANNDKLLVICLILFYNAICFKKM